VETFPVSGRMDRLRRLLYEEAEEQRKRHTKAMRKTYRDQLREIQLEKEREKSAQHKRKLPVGHKLLLFSLLSIEALLCFVLNGLLKIIEGRNLSRSSIFSFFPAARLHVSFPHFHSFISLGIIFNRFFRWLSLLRTLKSLQDIRALDPTNESKGFVLSTNQ